MGGDAALVETEQNGLGLHPVDDDADDVGDAAARVAHGVHALDGGGRLEQAVGLMAGGGPLGVQHTRSVKEFGGGTETDDGGDVFEAGPPGPFLLAADQERIEAQPAAHDQRADPRRSPQFVGADRHHVGPQFVESHRKMAGQAAGVDVNG